MLSVPPRRPREIRTSSQGSRDCVEEVSNDLWRYTIKTHLSKAPFAHILSYPLEPALLLSLSVFKALMSRDIAALST